jgi:hypothetical protein
MMILRRALTLLLMTATLAVLGCKSDESMLDPDLNELWRAGYGYKNPNADRIRKGLPPLNMDGSE